MLNAMKFPGVAAAASLSLLLAACSTTTSPSPTMPPAPTVAPTTAAAAAPTAPPAPTAVARPTQAPASTSPAGAAAPANAPAQANAPIKLVIDPSASQASYRARETLVGRSLPSDAVGTTKVVNGSIVLTSDGAVMADQSQISVDLSKLQSDESRRDNFIRSNTLQTSRFPMATFVPKEVQGLALPLPASGEDTFQLLGDLTVHGVTKPATWQVIAQFAERAVTGNATTSVKITDFGMTPPQVGPVLSIEDVLTLELAFTAAREA
jgi:polyisoprenoid-binding protein YceI